MATKKKAAKKGLKSKKRGGGKLSIGSDPPIIVGGGGSTWIWIKRDTNVQLFDPNNIPNTITPPDPAITPQTPALYNLLHLGDFSVTNVHFNNGNGVSNNHSVPNNPNGKSKNNTFFD